MRCRYCRQIHEDDPGYRVRRAGRDLGTDFPRCSRHWQFVCGHCRRSISFNGTSWCGHCREFFCLFCAPRHRAVKSRFWGWTSHYELQCPACRRYRPSLDRLEFLGRHPWQTDDSARRARRGLSPRKRTRPAAWMRWASGPQARPTSRMIQKGWDDAAELWDSTYDRFGDAYRKHIFNPALFRMLGDVRGKRVLDAGCGAGYFARLLAERGARVEGVDLSAEFIRLARKYEKDRPLGIRYGRGDIADLSRFRRGVFDLAVSVYVLSDVRDAGRAIREIGRVLKPGGRFLFLTCHPCFDWHAGGWERIPQDSQRLEDCVHFKQDNYFRRGALESQWGDLPVLLSFHRPLRDYFGFLREAGFLVRDLEEPRPLRASVKARPREWAREERIPPVILIDAVRSR